MVVLDILLAVAVLGPVADAPKQINPDDCVRAARIENAKPYPKKHVIVKHRRLFKSEPKPIVEPGCDEEDKPSTFTTIFPATEEPSNGEFSRVPDDLDAAHLPLLAVPVVAQNECGCFGGVGSDLPLPTGGAIPWWPGPAYPVPAPVAAVPEPAPALLILAGLGACAWRVGRRT